MQPLFFVYTQNAYKKGRVRKWGDIDITENMSYNSSVAKLNPFRYRGYYYDAETGLYYLNSRYYDPSIGRFINADDISYIQPTDINGLNLFAYCGNIPVNRLLKEEQVQNIAEQFHRYCYVTDEYIEGAVNIVPSGLYPPVSVPEPIVLFTSGTTGKFKGIRLTQSGLLFNIKEITKIVRYKPEDKMLISRSLAHIAALVGDLFVGIFSGVSFSFYDGPFSPWAIKKEIQEKRITLWNGTPTCLFSCAVMHTEIPIEKCVLSGEVLTESVYERIKKRMPKTIFYVGYGMTEAAPRISMGRLPKRIQRGYAGKLLKGIKAQSCNGEIKIKSPALACGYIGEAGFMGKWFHTHDRGYIKGKKVYVLGRVDGLIVRGGVNIDPVMIEEAIQADRNIAHCKVYGKPDEILGQKICAVVQPLNAGIVTAEYVMDLCRKQLPEFMQCNKIEIIENFKIGVTGKK